MRLVVITLATMGGLALTMAFTLADVSRMKKQSRREVTIDWVLPEEIRRETPAASIPAPRAHRRAPEAGRTDQARRLAWRCLSAPLAFKRAWISRR